ncbi:pre-rRNA processing protein [Puttea exsequens]|nr:pre-rRNA processing protein [Puttea exsequens]
MSSFFTTPASKWKRKREEPNDTPSTKRRHTTHKESTQSQRPKPARSQRDDSISSDGSDDESARKPTSEEQAISESESEDDAETGAERRLRLAEQYLQNLKSEVGEDIGFDAEQIDRDLIAERLQEDVAETKGRLYRHMATSLSFSTATQTQFRSKTLSTTSIATCPPYAYTVSKDLHLIKWDLPPRPPSSQDLNPENRPPTRRRPTKILSSRGNRQESGNQTYQHHTSTILCVAASDTGKFVATGGADKRLIIWSAANLEPLRVFTQHRDSVTSLAFRKGTNQLYSASKDRTIKTWSLDELAYVETLFGHQDEVVDVASLAMERCISVGARDRTARLWKVVEETQLVFRGGGNSERRRGKKGEGAEEVKPYSEGSIDRVAMIDDTMFVTGSDNGSLSLWTLQKKKPIFTVPLAHGLDPPLKPEEASAEAVPDAKVPERQPRWITALTTVPLSDLVISGSWDGCVRAWRVSEDKRRLEAVGVVGKEGMEHLRVDTAGGNEEKKSMGQVSPRGIVNDLSCFERGERGKDGLCIVAALGTESRLGRWRNWKVKGQNGALVFEISKIPQVAKEERNGYDEVVHEALDAS